MTIIPTASTEWYSVKELEQALVRKTNSNKYGPLRGMISYNLQDKTHVWVESHISLVLL